MATTDEAFDWFCEQGDGDPKLGAVFETQAHSCPFWFAERVRGRVLDGFFDGFSPFPRDTHRVFSKHLCPSECSEWVRTQGGADGPLSPVILEEDAAVLDHRELNQFSLEAMIQRIGLPEILPENCFFRMCWAMSCRFSCSQTL